MFEPESSYNAADLTPQDIREDFLMLTETAGYDPDKLLEALGCWLPADTLAEFMDDLAMARI